MSLTHRTLLAAAVLTFPVLLVSVQVAAEDGPPRAESGAPHEAGGEVAPEATEAKPEAPPPFDAQPFSDEKTRLPTKAEWKDAPRVTLDPQMQDGACTAWRVREWVRLRCEEGSFGAVRMLAGKRDGLQMSLEAVANDFVEIAGVLELVLPIRRGDARVIELLNIDIGYKGSNSAEPWRVVSEVWPAEDERPTIVFQ